MVAADDADREEWNDNATHRVIQLYEMLSVSECQEE